MCQELKDFETTDSKGHSNLIKSFAKERERVRRIGSRVKFQIKTFIMEWKSRRGVRKEDLGEMMWEGEFFEYGKSAAGGFKTREELEKEWQRMLADARHPRDTDGPRGYTRCWVRTKTTIAKFAEVSLDKGFRQEEKMSKNASADAINQRRSWALGAAGLEDQEGDLPMDDFQEDALKNLAGGHNDLDLITAPDVEALLQQSANAAKRKKGAKKGADEAASAEDEEKSDDAESSDGGKGPPEPKKAPWFDAETKCNSAERSFLEKADALQSTFAEVLQAMQAGMARVRAHTCPEVALSMHNTET